MQTDIAASSPAFVDVLEQAGDGDYGRQPPPSSGSTTTTTTAPAPIHGALPQTGADGLPIFLAVAGAAIVLGALLLIARLTRSKP